MEFHTTWWELIAGFMHEMCSRTRAIGMQAEESNLMTSP